jgi:hypothetical protein
MWQHAANIIIGLVLTALAFFGMLLGVVDPTFAWLYAAAGIAIVVLATWGLYDEFEHEENKGSGM